MPRLAIIYWRDIPAQVSARHGRKSAKAMLSDRFQHAVDRAAMRAGKGASDAYLEDWRREYRECGNDLETEVARVAAELEASLDGPALESLIKASGVREHAAT